MAVKFEFEPSESDWNSHELGWLSLSEAACMGLTADISNCFPDLYFEKKKWRGGVGMPGKLLIHPSQMYECKELEEMDIKCFWVKKLEYCEACIRLMYLTLSHAIISLLCLQAAMWPIIIIIIWTNRGCVCCCNSCCLLLYYEATTLELNCSIKTFI